MKILTSITLFIILSVTYGQSGFEPDPRIVKNFGDAKTKELVEYRPNLYNYYVYQLNHTCSILSAQDAKNESKTKADFKNTNGDKLTKSSFDQEYFNYADWGIEPDAEITKFYKLSDGSVLKVLSVRALTNEFRVSPKNTKYLY